MIYLHEALTKEQFNEIDQYLDDKYFVDNYCNNDYFNNYWEDYIATAAMSANITHGTPDIITGDPYYSEPGTGDELNSYNGNYDEINDKLFTDWVNDISRDKNIPELLKNNIYDKEVLELLRMAYDESVVPFNNSEYEEKILEYAGNYFGETHGMYDYDDKYEW